MWHRMGGICHYMGGASGLETQRGCLKGPGLLLEEQEQLRRHQDQLPTCDV